MSLNGSIRYDHTQTSVLSAHQLPHHPNNCHPELARWKRAREGPDEASTLAQASARLVPAPEGHLQSASATFADVRSLCRPPSEIRLRDDNDALDVRDGLLLSAHQVRAVTWSRNSAHPDSNADEQPPEPTWLSSRTCSLKAGERGTWRSFYVGTSVGGISTGGRTGPSISIGNFHRRKVPLPASFGDPASGW